jgi:hypothetical protein
VEEIYTEYGTFTNNEISGQTAQEVYNEWLLNRDKPIPKTENEIISERITGVENAFIMFMDMGL